MKGAPTSAVLAAGQVTPDGGGAVPAITLAMDVLPPLAEVTVTELFCCAATVPVTFTEEVQLTPPASAAPERLTDVDPATAALAPPPQAIEPAPKDFKIDGGATTGTLAVAVAKLIPAVNRTRGISLQ